MRTEFLPGTPKNWKDLKPHPLSALVEFGAGIDVSALAAHMRQHGYDQEEAIVLYEGQILDGRHKHIAAQEAEVVPTFRRFIGPDPLAYVAKKIHRQHLTSSQRAMLAAKLANGTHGGDRVSSGKFATCSQETAAGMLNISPRSVRNAIAVEENGTGKLKKAVMDGAVSVSDASHVANLPEKIQNDVVKNVLNGKAKTAAAAVNGKPKSTRPKVGAVLFDMGRFEGEWGALLRQIDKLGNAYDAKESREAVNLRQKLTDFRDSFKTWHKNLTSKK